PPERILALTFTEKAADELRTRINALTSRPGLTTAPFHAFCYQAVLEFSPDYRSRQLMTDGDALFLLREHYPALTALESSVFRREPPRAILAFKHFFDRLREELIDPARFPELLQSQVAASGEADDEGLELYHQLLDHCAVFPEYQRWKSEAGWVDYGDMVYECWRLLESRPEVLAALQDRYGTIIVDEFQDNNYALNVVVGRLAEKHLSVTVVGDDDQCIYAFRGASSYNLNDFRRRYRKHPHFAEIMLEENHRSTQPILDVANTVIAENSGRPDKRLNASRSPASGPGAGQLPLLAIGSSRAQLDYLATEISRLTAGGEFAPRDIAILARTNRQAGKVVAHLARSGIPSQYQNVGFFRLPAVRTALAWCSVVAGTPDAPAGLHRLITEHGLREPGAWQDAMERLFGEVKADAGEADSAMEALATRIERLTVAATTHDAAQLVERILATSGLYRKHFKAGFREDFVAVANLNLLFETAREFARRHRDNTLARFVQYITVMREADALVARWPGTADVDAVHVMTVHAAKGREFPVVFLPNLQSAQFPLNYRSPGELAEPPPEWRLWQSDAPLDPRASHLEEERRIFYVALTRARDRLTLLATPKRQSPFVRNLPRNLVMEKALPEQETPGQPSGAVDPLRAELTQRLSRELSRGAFEQAHQLVDALDLIGQHQAGQSPDFSSHPLGDELSQRLSVNDESASGPELQQDELTLSASGMASYETCPLQYRFARIEHIPTLDKPYMRLGTIVHAVLEEFHKPGRTDPRPSTSALLDQAW
ncbi:MAG: ATP-dependent DNA helicase, partial [Candidatus Neomarinimicrobiota bacterium]